MKSIPRKKAMYLLLLLVICLAGIGIKGTYAKFAAGGTTGKDIVSLNLSFNIGISNIEEYEEVVVEANDYKIFNVNIKNSSSNNAYYGVWYQMVIPSEKNDKIIIARSMENDTPTTDSIDSSANKTATIIIKNNTSSSIKVNVGVSSSEKSTDSIEYLGGKKLISGTTNEVDYYYDDTTSRYVSVKDNSITFNTNSITYSYTGSSQTFTPDHDGTYKLEAWGAKGGDFNSYTGGKGAYTKGTINLKKNDKLYVYVGGQGTRSDTGGYNGGGDLVTGQSAYGSSGGGATDFRIISGTCMNPTSLASRIMVAAGGGGANDRNAADSSYKYGSGNGGAGGALIGIDGTSVDYAATANIATYNHHGVGTGATQTRGGQYITYTTAGVQKELFLTGSFGTATQSGGNTSQAGGGGGYYGGGNGGHGAAGGGSSYISGYQGAISAGYKQKFKIVYTKGSSTTLNIYDRYNNLINSTSVTNLVQNINRTSNYIGKSNWDDKYFQGRIYSLKITLANEKTVLWYDFTKNTVADKSGNGYNGTLKNGASLQNDGKEYALVLDGTDDYLQVPTLPSSIDFAGGFTIEFEAVWTALNSWSRVMDFGNGSGSDNILIATSGTTTNLTAHVYNGATASEVYASGWIILTGTNRASNNSVCQDGTTDITCSYHYSGKRFINATMIAGNASMPNLAGTSNITGNSGNGVAKVTPVVPTIKVSDKVINSGENLTKNDITCQNNGSGCQVVRITDTKNLSPGVQTITIVVKDDFGYLYKYVKTITIGASSKLISSVSVGSYVKYTGNNGCSGKSCEGQNANYVSNTDMGYCYNSSYKFNSNGWRVAYINDGTAYLTSGGSPECMCTDSSGNASTSCSDYETTSGVPKHLANLNAKALTYCNSTYAYGGVCNSSSAWNMNDADFKNITGDTLSTAANKAEGYYDDYAIINNGGFYWFATPNSASSTYLFFWYPDYRLVYYNYSDFAIGVRPVLRLKSSAVATGGTGTYQDPYIISAE